METIAIISFLGDFAIGSIATLWCAAKVFGKEDEDSKNAEFEENLDREVLSKSAYFESKFDSIEKGMHDLFTREGGQDYRHNELKKKVEDIELYLKTVIIKKKPS